jgi:glycosyltransferase involved in cell wall biosynthesis
MKITLIGTLPPIKALSPYCYHLAEALSKKIDVDFINFNNLLPNFWYSGGFKEKKSYSFINFKTSNIINWYNPLSWIKAGFKTDGEIVHFQHWQLYASAMYCFIIPIVKIRGKKRIVTIHNITPHTADKPSIFLDKIFNKIIFPFTDFFIVHNKRNKKKLLELYKIDEKKISIIPHGTLMPYQKIKNISKEHARKHLNIPIDKKVILFFGYIWGYKGLDVLLKSLKIVRTNLKDFVLVIAGQPLDSWKIYYKIIEENRLDNNILKVLKYIPDSEIEYYFTSADLVVLPYYEHPFDTHGGVGALALSFKKPMVVTDVGGLPEYVKDERVISNPNNPNELAQKIIFVLSDYTLLEKLSKDSEELSKKLSWDKIADKTIDLYKKIY